MNGFSTRTCLAPSVEVVLGPGPIAIQAEVEAGSRVVTLWKVDLGDNADDFEIWEDLDHPEQAATFQTVLGRYVTSISPSSINFIPAVGFLNQREIL